MQAGIPQPPAIEEIFNGVHFGVPDWEAGARRLQPSPVDLSKWTKDLSLLEPAPIAGGAAGDGCAGAGADAGPAAADRRFQRHVPRGVAAGGR